MAYPSRGQSAAALSYTATADEDIRALPAVAQEAGHAAGAAMQTDYAGPTVEAIDPRDRQAQIFVAVLARR